MLTDPLPPRHLLSKSTFMYGCQCSKRLWLHKFQPDLRDEMDEEQIRIFQRGTNVGELARQLFPGGVNAAPPTPFEYQRSVADTARYIREGHSIIYEAAFQYEGLLCAIDIMVKRRGKWYGYEVKSSTSVKPAFVQDAAYQYYVISHSGIALADMFITHLNTNYIRRGALDLQQLFHSESVLEVVQEEQPFIIEKARELKSLLKSKKMPLVAIGDYCTKPYECDFMGHCYKDEADPDPEPAFIDKSVINEFLGELKYPLHYLDFETWMAAIPECDGHWSYRQIPFQYSLHKQLTSKTQLEHQYYLATHPHDGLDKFLSQLLKDCGSEGSILVYNKTFESQVLEKLKIDFPYMAKAITAIQDRMVDLMSPFRKSYRLPAMQGSYSIKYVLPALVPELSYDSLAINNGAMASAAFYELQVEKDQIKIELIRKQLLDYCGLDTMAMVRILEKLQTV